MYHWLSLFIGACYIILGFCVIIFKSFGIQLEANIAYALGACLIIYGIIRMRRAILKFKNEKNEN